MFFAAAAGAGDDLPEIGEFLEGGYFAGVISQSANGVATHGLIVAPAAFGYNSFQYKTSDTFTNFSDSEYDGASITLNIGDTNHPAANYCKGLSINGYSDWYLPARYELEIAYYNLKPTTEINNTSIGANSYAVPQRGLSYTEGNPAQTSVAAFQSGGAEAFAADNHWTATQFSTASAWLVLFRNGLQYGNTKTNSAYVRAFRKFAL